MRQFLVRLGGAVAALSTAACTSTSAVLADYPYYDSPAALFAKADLVVEADVARESRVAREWPQPGVGSDPVTNPQAGAPPGDEDTSVVITVHRASLVTVYKGTAKPGESIEVSQPGGRLDGVTYEVADAVPLTGARYVLFLATYPDGPADLLNPVQAQYRVDGAGNLTPVEGNDLALSRGDLDRLTARR